MTRDSPSQRKYTRHPDDRHEDAMTPTDNPFKALELTQLVADLKIVVSPVLYTDEGFARVAEALYDRGVRSRLHAPYRDGERLVHFTWDPELEGFEITEPGVYELRMEAADVPDIEPFPTFPRAELPRMLYRLVKKVGVRPVLQQMSEVPGHVQPSSEVTFRRAETLPAAVQRVIRFVAAYNRVYVPAPVLVQLPEAELSLRDLEATLAEIPDVAEGQGARYPTIWAYEQACRTIRERDVRIEKALEIAAKEYSTPQVGEADYRLGQIVNVLELRMPRLEPATEQERSEVARAFEACDTDDDAEVGDAWSGIARTLRDEALRLADVIGDQQDDLTSVVLTDAAGELVPCGTCSAFEPPIHTLAVGKSGRGWPRCAQHLVEDALDDAGLEKTVKRCSSCSHLASAHCEDGSGCNVTIRDVTDGHDNHCPCTFDARAEAWGTDNA